MAWNLTCSKSNSSYSGSNSNYTNTVCHFSEGDKSI